MVISREHAAECVPLPPHIEIDIILLRVCIKESVNALFLRPWGRVWRLEWSSVVGDPPFPQIDIIGAMVIVWRVRGKIIRSVRCNIVCNNCAHSMHTHMNRPNSSLDWVLSHWAHFTVLRFICRSSPRRWPSRLELRCVRTSTKSFSDFHLISCVGRPWPHMHTSVTSTPSKVKVKVTELPKLRKVHFSRSISSAISAWSSKLMVGGHSMGPRLQLVGARFLNFHLGKLSREFKHRPVSIFDKIQMAIFR